MFSFVKRPIESYNKIWLGALGLVMTGVLIAAVVVIGKLHLGKTSYRGEFAQAAQIEPGNMVTIAGIQVGTVEGVTLAGDHVLVTFNASNDVHLGGDTRAAIKLVTLLGGRYLELTPAGTTNLDDKTIPLAQTTVPFDLTETIASATSTLQPLDTGAVADGVTTLNRTLQGLPEALPQALDNLQSLATVMADRRDQIGTLLTNADTLMTTLRNQKADIGALVLQGRDLLNEIATRRAAFQRLLDAVTTMVGSADTILADEPAINQLIADAREFTQMMNDHDPLVRNILQSMPPAVRNLANATGSGNAIDAALPAGPFVDAWMCALSGRATQFNLVEYFKDCE